MCEAAQAEGRDGVGRHYAYCRATLSRYENRPQRACEDLVARTRFELVIAALRGRRPKPLDERAIWCGQLCLSTRNIIHEAPHYCERIFQESCPHTSFLHVVNRGRSSFLTREKRGPSPVHIRWRYGCKRRSRGLLRRSPRRSRRAYPARSGHHGCSSPTSGLPQYRS